MASDPPSIKIRFYVDRELAIAWSYHVVGDEERIMDVGLISESRQEIMRLGHDGASIRGFQYDWQRRSVKL